MMMMIIIILKPTMCQLSVSMTRVEDVCAGQIGVLVIRQSCYYYYSKYYYSAVESKKCSRALNDREKTYDPMKESGNNIRLLTLCKQGKKFYRSLRSNAECIT